MWADTLLAAERAHLLRLALWGAASLLVGTAVVVMLAGRSRSSLLQHFGIQTGVWGAVESGIALVLLRSLALRDLTSATQLDRMVWLNIGLDVGYALVGITLAVIGWRVVQRLGMTGAGIAIVLQGGALTVLDLQLASQISR
ncbi:MAG: hypothetical protein JF589_15260 [Gemmatimonadetes bacterium]|nr:hypothetical protein [Gemmatimonadota bacterium]